MRCDIIAIANLKRWQRGRRPFHIRGEGYCPCFETLLGSNIRPTSCSGLSKIRLLIHLARTSNLFLAGGDGLLRDRGGWQDHRVETLPREHLTGATHCLYARHSWCTGLSDAYAQRWIRRDKRIQDRDINKEACDRCGHTMVSLGIIGLCPVVSRFSNLPLNSFASCTPCHALSSPVQLERPSPWD